MDQDFDQEAAAQQPDSPPRRDFIRGAAAATAAVGAVTVAMHELDLVKRAEAADGTIDGTPMADRWWPSRWGKDDQIGATNWMGPKTTLDAVAQIKTGKVYSLGRVYEFGMPLFGQRAWVLRIPGNPTGGAYGKNQVIWHDEILSTEIGQVGTQFDGLGHIGCRTGKPGDKTQEVYYNGVTGTDLHDSGGGPGSTTGAYGLLKLGVENVRPFFCRGVLFDVAGLKGRMLDKGEEITVADLKACLARQGMTEADITEGCAVMWRTGWGENLWMKDNARFNSGEPGIGVEAAKWLAAKGVSVGAADCWAIEVVPNPDPNLAFPVHQIFLTRNGIHILENIRLDHLAADKVFKFAFVMAPLPMKGATGSPAAPIAVA
ncbi:MAG: cyclase family protein [Rhodocyclaceae bacterium]|nr:cyclase family protein [Rhodocyclaceae bacterium]MCA3133192.1 cyclase family protein [Rhodocyclaceae bacterium]MCA3144190.1 cyclase family protein [Rhodocyclaceae bacterium]